MKSFEKTKKELIEQHDSLCEKHDVLFEKYNNDSFLKNKADKLKLVIELKKLESRIDILSDAIESVDVKISLFNEMKDASTRTSKIIVSSETLKKSTDNIKTIIDREYDKLDLLTTKKILAHYFVNERRKGLKKYDLVFSSSLGALFGVGFSVLFSSVFQGSLLPFAIIGLGACAGMCVSAFKVKKTIKLFKQLNNDLGNDKLDMTSDNSMQDVYDLSSKISKKSHDIMIMETIYREQKRSLENIIESERKNNLNICSLNDSYLEQDLDKENKLIMRRKI